MVRLRRLFDIRADEIAPVVLTFLYVAFVVAAFLLARPIRNGLFLNRFGAQGLVYVYVGVPLVLSLFVPLYLRVAARLGQRAVITGTLAFFLLNVLAFWAAFTWWPLDGLPAAFYIWVNCFGVIAPVQAWTFAGTLFDTRQARRLFGFIGSGASLGAIAGSLMARLLVDPVGGTVNLMLVLAALLALSIVCVNVAWRAMPPRPAPPAATPGRRVRMRETLALILRTRYLRLIAAMVFLVAIVTQWTQFQFSLVATARLAGETDALTRLFGEFNFYLGVAAFLTQILLTGPALRRYGVGLTILMLPSALALGSAAIVLVPGVIAVFATNAADQWLRFSIDKAGFELLYLPLEARVKQRVKTTIDMIVHRLADGVGGILLGVATGGFSLVVARLPGAGFELRGTAAVNLALIGAWIAVAIALRRGYVDAIQESIRQHRLDAERAAAATLDRSATDALLARIGAGSEEEVLYALSVLEAQDPPSACGPLVPLIDHPSADVRRRALALLRSAGEPVSISRLERLVRDPDLETRTEALLHLTVLTGADPLDRIRELGDFPDFSVQAGIVACLASEGRARNVEAARVLLDAMVADAGFAGRRARLEAARLIALLPGDAEFDEPLARLAADKDAEVARQAVRAIARRRTAALAPCLVDQLGRPELAAEAAAALGAFGDDVVELLRGRLLDPEAPLDVRREIPAALVRIATPEARRALTDSLLQPDTTLRFRVIASLNKLRRDRPDLPLDGRVLEMVLAAEIVGHYRSYQILGRLAGGGEAGDPTAAALRETMEQEVERIFRLLGLLLPFQDLHSAYFGLRSADPAVRANALEFLDNVLHPRLRELIVPLLDGQVVAEARVRLADRIVGAPVGTREEAIVAMLGSTDPWVRSSAVHAVGALRLEALEPELDRLSESADPAVRESARAAKASLAGAAAPAETPAEAAGWSPGETGVG